LSRGNPKWPSVLTLELHNTAAIC